MAHQFDSNLSGSLDIAQTDAIGRRNLQLEPIHLLQGLAKNPHTTSHKALKALKPKIESILAALPVVDKQTYKPDNLRPSPQFAQLITQASADAIQSGRQEISERDILKHLDPFVPGLGLNNLMQDKLNEQQENEFDFLINLNELAREGKLDPVIGRTKEIRAVMEILGRRTKNNPVLVGEAGVGKTAVVEGLAGMIESGKVPDTLKNKQIYSLDMGLLMAGTKFRGEFEERMKKMVQFIKDSHGQIILFIDELHLLVGAGKTDGAMDAANLLKPALARGELHCIGATTNAEYRRYILSDQALDRRFRLVPVQEPSVEDAIEIMLGVKEKLEIHHGIDITDEAIYASVFLSKQYITDKQLPDKAIDLVDEAASALKLSAEAMPPSLSELQAEIRSKMIYAKTQKNTDDLMKEIDSLKAQFETEKAKWDKEVFAIKRVSELKNKLERLKFEQQKAETDRDYERASQLKYSEVPEVEKELKEHGTPFQLESKHIAEVIARQTGIPVEKILKSKQESILEVEAYLNQHVFGQRGALHEISETLISAHAGLTDQSRPLASFLLMGPTGVGKTETAKTLAQFLFNSSDKMIRLDMSEFSEKHSVAKLIGSPAGYVGYEDGGILTEAVRRKPYAVILFDEIEKAHPDFADILLQILDDGRLTDNKGRTVSFLNTIVMLTTNATNPEATFKPEVLGRLDGVVKYKPLDKEIVSELIGRETKTLNERLASKDVTIDLDEHAIEKIKSAGYDPAYGARPLRAAYAKLITQPLSRQLLKGELTPGHYLCSIPDVGPAFFKKVDQ